MSSLLTRMFARARTVCADCQVGQGRVCACRVRQAPCRIPTPVLMLAIYGGSVALVVGVAVSLWRAFA